MKSREKEDLSCLELYIHIPFCVRKCAYCDFLSFPSGEEERERYVERLTEEIEEAGAVSEGYVATAIFFGGGTPSVLTPKQTERKGSSILYFKQSETIEELLALMGAPVSAMTVMQAKIEKDWRNDANRKTNCDTANVTKAVDAAQEQLAALRTLEAQGRLDSLPEKLLQTALLRREHPEATLSELAELHEPPTSKSTVNHRMRKLLALAAEGTETTEEGPA